MEKKIELTRSEINTLIAATTICSAIYGEYGSNKNKSECEKYTSLDEKLRSICYDGDKINNVTISNHNKN